MSRDKTIIRTRKSENPFVMVDKYGVNDDRLSWKAKGILVYLLSKPDDWVVRVADLIKRAKDGRDSVRSGLRELEDNGYLEKYQHRDENGTFGEVEYIVYERPIEPQTENPSTDGNTANGKPVNGKSVNGKTPPTNNNYTKNNLTKNNNNNKGLKKKDGPEKNCVPKGERSIEKKPKEKDVVVDDLQSSLKNKGINVNKSMLDKWRSTHSDEHILLAAQGAAGKPNVRNVVGYITRMLEAGYEPPARSVDKLPSYMVSSYKQEDTQLSREDQIIALDLLLQLNEIDQVEYDRRVNLI